MATACVVSQLELSCFPPALSLSLTLLRATIPADKAWAKEVQRKSAQNTVGDSTVISPKSEKVSSSGVRTDLASARRMPRHSLPSCTFAYRKCGSGSTFARVRGSFLAFCISRRAVNDESIAVALCCFLLGCFQLSHSHSRCTATGVCDESKNTTRLEAGTIYHFR